MRARPLLTLVLALAGCDQSVTSAEATLVLSAGLERDTWDQAPVPTEVTILGTRDATQTVLGRDAWPASSLGLGALESGTIWSFRAEFRDAAGALLLAGVTPALEADAIAGGEVLIHCGRVGAFSRPSQGLARGWDQPLAGALLGRYVLVTGQGLGSDGVASELLDLATMSLLGGDSALPRSPRTLAGSAAGVALLVNDAGATRFDLVTGESAELTADEAGDASGGLAVEDGAGGAYIVGAARASGAPTRTVLRLDRAGGVTKVLLNQARVGAAATWVAGAGLVVAGGDAEASLEILAPGASAFVSTGLVVPSTLGATLAPVASGELLLAGGAAPDQSAREPLRLSIACAAGCQPAQPAGVALAARGGHGYDAGGGKALLIGEGASGTEATLVSAAAGALVATPVPLRKPRRRATSVRLDDGRVLVVGGVDEAGAGVLDVEIFTPG